MFCTNRQTSRHGCVILNAIVFNSYVFKASSMFTCLCYCGACRVLSDSCRAE